MRLVYILPFLFLTVVSWGQSKKELKAEIQQLKKDKKQKDELLALRDKEIVKLKSVKTPGADPILLKKKNAQIDSLKKVLASLEKTDENPPNLNKKILEYEERLGEKNNKIKTLELQLKNKLKEIKKEVDQLQEKNALLASSNQGLKTTLEEKQKYITQLKQNLAAQKSANQENDLLKDAFFGDISDKVKLLIKNSDYKTTLPKIAPLEAKIEKLKQIHPDKKNSLNTYTLKLKWYKDYASTLNQSIALLDQAYDLEKVVSTKVQLENLKKSSSHNPTADQIKKIDTQIKSLDAYCGRYNYLVNKLDDANSFGTYKAGALEEINAAIKRIEKEYSFLVNFLDQRKKDPTNSKLSLKRVVCP